jgi:hypothetical protein
MQGSKAGWKTSEFWLSLAALSVSVALGSGIVPEGSLWEKILGISAAALVSLGYTVSRTRIKTVSMLPLVIMAVLSSACGLTLPDQINRADQAVVAIVGIAKPVFDERCTAVAKECGSKGDTVCTEWQTCAAQRRKLLDVAKDSHLALILGASLSAVGDEQGAKARLAVGLKALQDCTKLASEFGVLGGTK